MAETWQRHVTEIVLIAVPLLVIAWDLWAVWTPGATISEVTIHLLYQHPVLALYIGMLFGHLCYPVVATRPHWITVIIVVCVIALGIVADRLHWLPVMMPVIPLVVGIPLGHLLWPQKVSTETGAALYVQTAPATLSTRTITQNLPLRPPAKP